MNQMTDITLSESFSSIYAHLMFHSSHQQPDSTRALLGQVSMRNTSHLLLEIAAAADCCSWEMRGMLVYQMKKWITPRAW